MTTITFESEGRTATTTTEILRQAAATLRGGTGQPIHHGAEGDQTYPVPYVADAYRDAPELEALAAELVERHPDTFGHLRELTLKVLWKAKAGKASGKIVFGKTQKPSKSSLLSFYEPADFVIWLAADAVAGALFTRRQVEALLAHELMHTAIDDKGAPATVSHDFEGFARELELYGFWEEGLQTARRATQARMRLEATGEVEDEDGDDV